MIKEMRDVEQRLGKPDPSEDTQAKQKQIVKRIDTLIEQVRQSGSSAGRLTIRRGRQARAISRASRRAIRPALSLGALPPMKPAKPTSQHSRPAARGSGGTSRTSCARSWKHVQGGDAGLEGGADQPVLPLGRQGEARPGGVTSMAVDRGAAVLEVRGWSLPQFWLGRCSVAVRPRCGRSSGRARPGQVGRGVRRVASRRRSRGNRSR